MRLPVCASLLLMACGAPQKLTPPTAATTATPPPKSAFSTKPSTSTLQVVHIGDSEAGLLGDVDAGTGGVARTRAIIDALVRKSGSSIVVHAGDTLIPAPELALEMPLPMLGVDKPKSPLLVGNDQVSVQVSAFGNHDLDLGEGFAADVIKASSYPMVSSTLLVPNGPLAAVLIDPARDGTPTPWVHESRGHLLRRARLCTGPVIDGACQGGVVGVVGTSPEGIQAISKGAQNVSTPATPEGTLAALQTEVDALRKEGLSVVVLLSHRQGIERDLALIELGLTGVDVVVSGGGENLLASSKHRLRDGAARDPLCERLGEPCYPLVRQARDGAAVVVVATEGDLRSVGSLGVSFDDEGRVTGVERSSRPWPVDEESLLELRASADTKLVAFELAVRDALAPLRKVVGETPVLLEGTREIVRNGETNLGSLSADALLAAARTERPDVTAAFRNAGGIRGSIPGPHITLLDVKSTLRFDSKVVIVDVSHSELVDTLDVALHGAGTARGHFPQVSGNVELVYGVWPEVCPQRRVERLVIDGLVVVDHREVQTPEARIAVATIDYLANGGDGWFAGPPAIPGRPLQGRSGPGAPAKPPIAKPATTPTKATEQTALMALLADKKNMAASLARTGRIVMTPTEGTCH